MPAEHYDDNPGKYVNRLFVRAKEWFEQYRPALQEQWDMWQARDEYIEERKRSGHAALSFPSIFASIEAIYATIYEILQAHDNLMQFEPIHSGDVFGRIASERLQSGFQNIRADLEWDSKILDMVILTTVMDWANIHMEPETISIGPGHGIVAGPEMMGTEKLYPSFNVYAPGRIIWDGSVEKDKEIEAYFKMRFESYQWVVGRWPQSAGDHLKSAERSAADSDYFKPSSSHRAYSTSSGLAKLYDASGTASGGSSSGRRGYLVVEAHVNATFKDKHVEQRVYTYLPEVQPPPEKAQGDETSGWKMEEDARAFESVDSMQRTCRSRRVPLTNRGRGTSGLLLPFQRHLSAQVSTEAQLDMLAMAPPILYRAGAFVGTDSISFDPFDANPVNMEGVPPGTSLSEMAQQMQFTQSGRPWARDTKTMLQNMMDLVAGAYEGDTGEAGDPNETATKTNARQRGGQRRTVTQFAEHAGSIIWMMTTTLLMMREAPSQFLYPPIMAGSETLGRAGILTEQDTQAAVRARVPALSEYAAKQEEKIIWRMVGDGFAQIPLFAESYELQMWYVEKMIRALRVPESEVQEAMAAAKQGLEQAQMQAMLGAMPPEVGGGRPAPGQSQLNPGGVAQAANLQPMAAA